MQSSETEVPIAQLEHRSSEPNGMLEFRASDLTALSSLTEEPGEPFANRARFIIIKNNYFLIILIFDYTFQLCCSM